MSWKDKLAGYFVNGSSATPAEGDVWTWDNTNKWWRIRALLTAIVHTMTGAAHTATNWRVFYSNDSATVVELALGAAATYLRSGGAAAAPAFAVPTMAEIANTPAGSVSAVTGQAAIDELDAEKQAILAGGAWLEASVNLTDAQIKALLSVPVELIAAPGANKTLQLVALSMALDNAAGLYVGAGVIRVQLASTLTTGSTTFSNGFLTADASASKLAQHNAISSLSGGSSTLTNAACTITATSDFTGGNAANKATVKVVYRILSTLPE